MNAVNQRIAEDLSVRLGRQSPLHPRHQPVVWWLLDKSPQQRATRALVRLMSEALRAATLTLRLPKVGAFILAGDRRFQEALIGEP